MGSPELAIANSKGKSTGGKAPRKVLALEAAVNPHSKYLLRGPDPGSEPPPEFPCRSWRFAEGRGDLGSVELRVGVACHTASRDWATAEAEGQDAVDGLSDTTVTLAIADKAMELLYQATTKRSNLPSLEEIEGKIVSVLDLLYVRHEDARSAWLDHPREVPFDLGPYADVHEAVTRKVYRLYGDCSQEPYILASRGGKIVQIPIAEDTPLQ
ncbi:hypothetical protein A1Q1_00067 [Trichosporon asahii var. asahii CBS 2479]|uniref:Uncharacterized protein n=1 Tax=Trichosporon asahii var. asahii (strain ATCC 90039 / CBS 2479 / JCM 2466 / KCTC 7840 / NBRC 103889/ NCYC 2677 / UAMH 7654) TaxID=1186058 RepID=J8TZ41_TRIAS|nr:hypothetical protein A1Q1_00067 [Trichosporon asahii var. asahii CBS 2479]EJT53060.1 hypothetical protein A1Q1_00067 [Trichosporon asahii var. asahii CBS 2479]